MKVYLTAPRGFCAGVDRAIDVVDRALEIFGTPIFVRHEIVHNKYVVEQFRAKGVIFVEDISDVPDNSVLIFSAHGVSKEVRRTAYERPLKVIDATCPLVTKVHLEVHRLDREGYEIVLIGHAGHVEVEGTLGQLPPEKIKLVQNPEEARKIDVANPNKLAYVTQTTLSLDETADIVAALKERFPSIRAPNKDDICYATQNRQNAVKVMLEKVDLFLVIGSKNSSNSNRLVEVARAGGVRAYLFDHPDEMQQEWFEGVSAVGLTAGASAPEDLVRLTVRTLEEKYAGKSDGYTASNENIEFNLPKELTGALAKVS